MPDKTGIFYYFRFSFSFSLPLALRQSLKMYHLNYCYLIASKIARFCCIFLISGGEQFY